MKCELVEDVSCKMQGGLVVGLKRFSSAGRFQWLNLD